MCRTLLPLLFECFIAFCVAELWFRVVYSRVVAYNRIGPSYHNFAVVALGIARVDCHVAW